jgi:hypothetical protein
MKKSDKKKMDARCAESSKTHADIRDRLDETDKRLEDVLRRLKDGMAKMQRKTLKVVP